VGTRMESKPVPLSLADWLTTQQVAERYAVTSRTVLRLIREGRLTAHKVGWVWLVHRDDLPVQWPPPIIKR
jgi:excisionase family DNA binding protein